MRSRGGFGEVSGFEQGWGRISILVTGFGLDCCLEHGEEGMERWMG
jgi:hypothetical protein